MAHFIFLSAILLHSYILCTSRESDKHIKNITVISSKKEDVESDNLPTFSLPFGARISKHLLKDQNTHRQSQLQQNLTSELHQQRRKIKKRKKIVKLLNQKRSGPLNENSEHKIRKIEEFPFRNNAWSDEYFNDNFSRKSYHNSFDLIKSENPYFDLSHTNRNSSQGVLNVNGENFLKTAFMGSTYLPHLNNRTYTTAEPKNLSGNTKKFFSTLNLPVPTTNAPHVSRYAENSVTDDKFIPDDCSCFWSKQNCGCSCFGSLNVADFQILSKFFQPCKNFSFTVQNGKYFSFPLGFFSNVGNAENFYLFVSNATFDYLFEPTPLTSAFQNVSFSKSAVIRISDAKINQGWNWAPLSHIKSTTTDAAAFIEIDSCGLNRLSSDFAQIMGRKIKDIIIHNSDLQMIGSGAFSNFEYLTHFRVPRNKITIIKRTDLPPNPLSLLEVDLSDNRISFLEVDLFTEMPSLQIVSLSGNPLSVIFEEAFQAVIGKVYLPGLASFSLNCDCQLKWLKTSPQSNHSMVLKNLEGVTCKRPPHLRGTPFSDLSEEHLICPK